MKLPGKIEELKSCDLNCNIFSVYDYDGYSIQELLCEFFTRINNCIEVSNKTLELAEWLVNEGLAIEVAKKLEQWLQDGTLAHIINEVIFKELNDKINGVNEKVIKLENRLTFINPTDNIKDVFAKLEDNTTVIINGKHTVDTLLLQNKNNITIQGPAEITQNIVDDEECGDGSPAISKKPTLRFYKCNNVILKDMIINSKYESIDAQNVDNFTVENCTLKGISASKFNNIAIRDSQNAKVIGNKIIEHGIKSTWDNSKQRVDKYGCGHGVGFYLTENIIVSNNFIKNNGANGIYGFVVSDMIIDNNIINNNCMSGIQLAWSRDSGLKQTGYTITGNDITYNWADSIDLNNTTNEIRDCNLTFTGNNCYMNGWFNNETTKPTQDGSGMTITLLRNITSTGNAIKDCAGAMLFAHKAENVIWNNTCIYTKKTKREYLMSIEACKKIELSGTIEDTLTEAHGINVDLYQGDTYQLFIHDMIVKCRLIPLYLKEPSDRVVGKIYQSKANNCHFYGYVQNVVQTAIEYNFVTFEVDISTKQDYPIIIGEGKSISNCKFITHSHKIMHPAGLNTFNNCEFITEKSNQALIVETPDIVFNSCKFTCDNTGTPIYVNDGAFAAGKYPKNVSFNDCISIGRRGIEILPSRQSCDIYINGGYYKSIAGDNSIRIEEAQAKVYVIKEPTTDGPAEWGSHQNKKTITWK